MFVVTTDPVHVAEQKDGFLLGCLEFNQDHGAKKGFQAKVSWMKEFGLNEVIHVRSTPTMSIILPAQFGRPTKGHGIKLEVKTVYSIGHTTNRLTNIGPTVVPMDLRTMHMFD